MLQNERAKIVWDFLIQTNKQVMVNQPDNVVVDNLLKKSLEHNTSQEKTLRS